MYIEAGIRKSTFDKNTYVCICLGYEIVNRIVCSDVIPRLPLYEYR